MHALSMWMCMTQKNRYIFSRSFFFLINEFHDLKVFEEHDKGDIQVSQGNDSVKENWEVFSYFDSVDGN